MELWKNANGCTIRGLAINGGWNGITARSGGHLIELNYLGVDADGVTKEGNANNGLEIHLGYNTIRNNVISDTPADGISLGPDAPGNIIAGNLIGTTADGLNNLGNGGQGIVIESINNIVGGNSPQYRNVISGNGGCGILFAEAGGHNNQVIGNFIGTEGKRFKKDL